MNVECIQRGGLTGSKMMLSNKTVVFVHLHKPKKRRLCSQSNKTPEMNAAISSSKWLIVISGSWTSLTTENAQKREQQSLTSYHRSLLGIDMY